MLQRSLMIVLMLMILSGQAAAISIQPCNMMMNVELPMSQMDHTSNQHNMHSMAVSLTSAQNLLNDCCDSDSDCFMGHCVSVGVLALSINAFMPPQFTTEKISLLSSLTENQFSTSLFRPPISH